MIQSTEEINNNVPTADEITHLLWERPLNKNASLIFQAILSNTEGWRRVENKICLSSHLYNRGLTMNQLQKITSLRRLVIAKILKLLISEALIIQKKADHPSICYAFKEERITTEAELLLGIEKRKNRTKQICKLNYNKTKSNHKQESIKELQELPYDEYLKTDHWKRIKERKLKQCKYKCQLCSSVKKLNVHHNTYENKGQELLSDLVVLCESCHTRFHDRLET